MFTDGHKSHTGIWIRQERILRDLGMPPPGRLPRTIPEAIKTEDYGKSDSDMDLSSDTEEEEIETSNGASRKAYDVSAVRQQKSVAKYVEEEEFYDSDASLESSTHNVTNQGNRDSAAVKGLRCDVPSAPPLHYSYDKTNNASDQWAPPREDFDSFSEKNVPDLKHDSGIIANNQNSRSPCDGEVDRVSSCTLPLRFPTFHASGEGPWLSVIAYDACVRLCLHSWARGCMEAPIFLENECTLLKNAFGLQHILLQSEEELLEKQSSDLATEGAPLKPKKIMGKMKVQVHKVRMATHMPSGCSILASKPPMVKLKSLRCRMTNLQAHLSSRWESFRGVHMLPHLPANSSFSRQSMAYMHAGSQYAKLFSGLLRTGLASLRSNPSYESVQDTYYCLLRLKSSSDEDMVRLQPGSGEAHMFFPDGRGDDLIVEVYDSKGKCHGRAVAQVASVAENPMEKLRWWSIFHEPEHELVGRTQLYITYTPDEYKSLKCGSVAETLAYDLVLEVAMKVLNFQQRKLMLHGSWNWLVKEFASYYGVSEAYTKLRYVSYVMDVATPTADCLELVHDMLSPVIHKNISKSSLSRQENRILGEIKEQIDQLLASIFENYKVLDETSPSGMMEAFRPASGCSAPALAPAVKLYALLHDILLPEVQLQLCGYFQAAARKRSKRHMAETDEYIATRIDGDSMDVAMAYRKMKILFLNIRHEIFTDTEINGEDVLPSFIDLPNLSASIYSVELCNRLRQFLVRCPPNTLSKHVAELLVAVADFQKDLARWNICPIKGGVDAKELFHLYIMLWIQDKRLSLLESCKSDKAKWTAARTQNLTTPFIDEMYDSLRDMLNDYEIIICRWPEYIAALESVFADIEKGILVALEQQYADVLIPLKDMALTPMQVGLKYVQNFAKRTSATPYIVTKELGIFLNSVKRLLDVLRPKIEAHFKSWGSCMPDSGSSVAGEHLNEVTVMLRTKFRNYLQAVVEKLAETTRAQSGTKLKKIIQDSKDIAVESDIRSRMQPLRDHLIRTISHIYTVFHVHIFVALCRGYWDRMGMDILKFLESRKENKSWYKASCIALSLLDDTFASQMQQLLGNTLQESDLEPPRSIMEVRSILCKGSSNLSDSNFYY